MFTSGKVPGAGILPSLFVPQTIRSLPGPFQLRNSNRILRARIEHLHRVIVFPKFVVGSAVTNYELVVINDGTLACITPHNAINTTL